MLERFVSRFVANGRAEFGEQRPTGGEILPAIELGSQDRANIIALSGIGR
jgi:hypothetical protein